jgi:hypothetical protein
MTTTLRLTRRGRIVAGTLLAIPALSLSMLLASPGALAGDEPRTNDFEYHTVLAGDTLWGIASIIDPGADPRDVVTQIMTLNGLTNASVSPGQQLAIPR